MHHQNFVTLFVLSAALLAAIGCGGSGEQAPEIVTTTFTVAGMTCESCDAAINHSVAQLEGVTEVEAHHDPGEAKVTYDEAKISAEMITEKIEGLGYTVVSP